MADLLTDPSYPFPSLLLCYTLL